MHADMAGFSPQYLPIFPSNKYFGKGNSVPDGKVRGKPHECLAKGFGIGQKLQYERRQGEQRGYHFTASLNVFLALLLVSVVLILSVVVWLWGVWILLFILLFVTISTAATWVLRELFR